MALVLVVLGFGITNWGFYAASRKAGAASLLGALAMIAGLAATFGGLLLGLIPDFFR